MVLTVDRRSRLPSGPSTVMCHPPQWPVWRRTAGSPWRAFLQAECKAGKVCGKEVRSSIFDFYCLFPSNDDTIFMGDVRHPPSQHLTCCPFCMGHGMVVTPAGKRVDREPGWPEYKCPTRSSTKRERNGFLWHFPFSLLCVCFYVLLLFWEDL